MKLTILWIFILYFITLPRQTYQSNVIFRYQCPQGCFCVPDIIDTELLIISCRWQKLNLIKETFPKNVTKSLTIQCLKEDDEKKSFNENLLAGFSKIQELRILHCKTKFLTAETFQEISTLQSLYLLNISLSPLILTQKLLQQFKNLEKLTLVKSQLEEIENGALCAIPTLQILNLSFNRLKTANIGVQASSCLFPHLIILDLSHNNIQYLSDSEFNAFPSIRQLSLSSNNLQKMDNDAFKSINLIQHLDLDNNKIKKMIPLSDNLLHINLAQNKLTTIPVSVANLLSLISLNISENLIDSKTPFLLLSNSIEIIDLSKNRFTEIPLRLIRESMNTILNLNLANNDITEIKPFELQNFSQIKEFDFSNNNIKSLPFGIFNGLNELTTLRINNNSIYHIDIEVFNDLNKKLTTLEIANNLLTELPMAIGRLSKIKTIDCSGNQISKAYKFVLNKITHLTKLDLSNNNLQEIDSYIFSDSAHLSELILRNNQIKKISNDAFEKCPRLKKLDLAGNQLSKLGSALTQIRSLRTLNISSNNFEHLEWNEIPSELHDLHIINNQIKSVSRIQDSHVKILNIQKNQMQSIETEQLPPLIEELDISYNQLQQISKDSFLDKTQLKSVNLQNNSLKTIPDGIFDQSLVINANFPGKFYLSGNPLVCNCEMSWVLNATAKQIAVNIADITEAQCTLPFSNKKIFFHDSEAEDFLCRYNQTCEPGCICCQYGNCDCKSKCPDGCECFRDNNYKTNIVKCHSTIKQKIIVRELPMYASHIYLSKVNLPVLRSHDFIGRLKLTQLHITSSNLHTIEPLALNTLPKLRVLNLFDNKLQRINGDESFKTQRLQKLNIEKNNIIEIDPRLAEIMPNLETLQASKNLFENLPKYLEKDTAKDKLKHIYLSENPFRCDCSISNRFQAQNWFLKNKNRVVDSKNVFCVENITQALLTNDTTVLTSLPPNYKNDLFMIPMLEFLKLENRSLCVIEPKGIFGGANAESTIFLSLVATFLLLLMAAVLIYASSKRKIEQKYERANSFSPDNSVGNSPLPSGPLIQYDVFVSYSMNDEKSVVQKLCRPLEVQDYSLCLLHHVGSSDYNNGLHIINDELNKQLKTCQTLLIFITKSFLENEWKTVQIRTSHKIFAKMKNKKLIAIISDEVQTNELDDELGQILRKNTCIQQNHQLFWNLLMSALPERECSVGSETSQIYSDAAYGSIVPSEIV